MSLVQIALTGIVVLFISKILLPALAARGSILASRSLPDCNRPKPPTVPPQRDDARIGLLERHIKRLEEKMVQIDSGEIKCQKK